MPLMRHRYLLAFLAAAVILALVGASIMLGTQRYREDARMVVHTLEVIGANERAHADVLRAIASQRSYILTDDAAQRDLGLLQTCRNVPEALDVTRRMLSVLMPTVAGTVS